MLLIPINAGNIVVGVAAMIPPLTPPSFSTKKVAKAAMQPENSAAAAEVKIARSPNLGDEDGILFWEQERPFI